MAKENEWEFPPNGHVGIAAFYWADGKWHAIRSDGNDYLIVNAAVVALPTGAATAAKQLPAGHGVVLNGDGLQLRRGDHVVVDYDAVPGDTASHDLINTAGAGVLEYLSFASDHADSYISVNLDGNWLALVNAATPSTESSMKPFYLQYGEKEDSIWKLIVHDAGSTQFGISIKRPLWFNTSVRALYHAGSDTAKISMVVGYHLF